MEEEGKRRAVVLCFHPVTGSGAITGCAGWADMCVLLDVVTSGREVTSVRSDPKSLRRKHVAGDEGSVCQCGALLMVTRHCPDGLGGKYSP